MAAPTMKTSLPSTGPGRSVRKAYNVDPRMGPRAFPIQKEHKAFYLRSVILMTDQ